MVLLAACGAGPGDDPSARPDGTAIRTDSAAPSATPAAPSEASATLSDTSWTVRMDGAGPLRVGMTVQEARTALGGDFRPVAQSGGTGEGCTYAESARFPAGFAVMLDSGRIVRVEVRSGATPTPEGARIGDSEDRVRQTYPGRGMELPHKYVQGGHDMVIRPAAQADTTHLMIFETDGGKVTRYRAGQRPQVEWVEGCS
jgi:hypothetical protein